MKLSMRVVKAGHFWHVEVLERCKCPGCSEIEHWHRTGAMFPTQEQAEWWMNKRLGKSKCAGN